MSIPATTLQLLADRWRRKLAAGQLTADACLAQLEAVLLLPNAPRDMQAVMVAQDIFGKHGVEALHQLQEAAAK